jgi:serine/threonine protein kinase
MESPKEPNAERIIDGRYRLKSLLGTGGFGSVYLAFDENTRREVAIKLTNAKATEQEKEAFFREARTLANVTHPNIADVVDFGNTEKGEAYLVRSYVEGHTVDQLLKTDGPLELKQALTIALAVTRGLQALHEQGIIHRDLKPSNILVPDDPSRAMLMDFGVTGLLKVETQQTVVGELFGTPYYMAPEQLQAQAQSPATDIYGLAATLYEMIFGKVAFPGQSLSEIVREKFAGSFAFPANENVPESLRSFLRRSLSVDPKDRPQPASAVIEQLTTILKSLPTTISSTTSPKTKQPRASKTLAVPPRIPLLAKVVIAVVVSTTLAWLKWFELSRFLGVALGALIAISGFIVAVLLRRWINSRRSEVEIVSGNLLLSSKSRIDLTESLAINVNHLIGKVRRLDDKILATSLAIMVSEFQGAEEGQMRQAAIMNVVQLLEKLTARLSPWYVRHEKLLAVAVTAVGIVSGVTTAAASIVKLFKGQ